MRPLVIGDAYTTVAPLLGWAMIFGVVGMAVRYWLQRRAAARAPAEQQHIWHGEFMRTLIQLAGHDTAATKRVTAIRRRLKWSWGQVDLVIDYLQDKGLIKGKKGWLFPRVKLTGAGFDETRRAERGPTEHLPRIVADHSVVTVNSPNSSIHSPASSVGSPGSAIQSPGSTQTLVQMGMDPAELASWIHMYRDALDRPTSLSENSVRHAKTLLFDLDDAMSRGDATTAESLGRTLRAIAEGVTGNAAFAAVLAAARAFPFGL